MPMQDWSSDSSAVRNVVISQLFIICNFIFMLYGYNISNISNVKIGPLFYFTLNIESLYNRLQYLFS